MDAATFAALAMACAPQVDVLTAHALVQVESGFNPWAIGVVGGALERQPQHKAQALATARSLQAGGWNFSVGLAQINLSNFAGLGLTLDQAFEPCHNLAAMQAVLAQCYRSTQRAAQPPASRQQRLRRALSCYYSGNFTTGFQHGYVHKVVSAAAAGRKPVLFVNQKEQP